MVSARGRPLISSPHFAFFILTFISAAHGTRHNHGSNQCHIGCHGSGGGLGFEDGYKYEYKYEGSSKMQVGGSSADLAPLDLTATVSVTPISACNLHLQLTDVRLIGHDNKRLEIGSILKGSSGIVAGLDSTGKLVSQICAPPDQSSSHTNLHRAVLSLLQSHVPKHIRPSLNATLHQTDVFGVCRTDYSIKENEDEIDVLSTVYLDSCAHREDARLPIVTSPYHSKSGFDRTNILESTQSREQKFLNRILQEAKSREFYTLAPLTEESAASVTVTSKLSLVKKVKSTTAPVTEKYEGKSVIFEVADDEIGSSTFDEIKKSLMKISDGKVALIKEKSPREFNLFVKKLEGANKDDIIKLFNDIKERNDFKNQINARSILIDGLMESASPVSVQVLPELLKMNELSHCEERSWLESIPNTRYINEDVLLAAKKILQISDQTHPSYLGVGTLVGKYCTRHDCQNSDMVEYIEEFMMKPLFESCKPVNFADEMSLMVKMKGLGNIRFLSDKVAKRLSECALDPETMVRVRVAALETMKTDSNKPIIQETLKKILRNIEEDSEIRIKAYLAFVEKPSGQVAETVKEVLTSEKSNQVGGFIVSHLRNVRSSTNPDKEALRHHLGGIYTRSGKFGWDPKKYSQNYELSYNGEDWGAAGEANVIYSNQGYLPRSVNFNLTTVLYGHSFNLFDVGIRSEGAERIFERLLKSLTLKKENVNDLLNTAANFTRDITSQFDEFDNNRPKRSVEKEKINDFYQRMAKPPKVYHDNFVMDFSVKSLGAEIMFLSQYGDDLPSRPILFNGLKYLRETAKNVNIEYSKHMTFLDGEIIYPTGLGLPMRLKTKGSAAFGLTLDANLDLSALMRHSTNSQHLKLKFIPSGSIEVIGALTMDASNVETGIEVTLAAHSSTGGDVNLKLIKGKELEIVIGVPLREQKIITASTGLNSIFRHNQETVTTPIDLDINKVSIEEYSGCFEQLVTHTGLTFCGVVSVPNNNMPTINPFYGPSKVAFSVHVEDDTVTSYIFKTSYERFKEKNKQKLHILVDTPGSKLNRKISIGFESEDNPELKHMKLHMESFWTSLSVQGSMVDTEKELSVGGKLKYDDKEYSTKAGVALTKSSPTITVYKPFFHYSFPQYQSRLVSRSSASPPVVKLSGEVIVEKKEEDGLTTYLFNHVTLEVNRSNYTIDGSLSSQIKGDSSTLNTDLKILYFEHFIAINSTLSRLGLTRLEGNLVVFPSARPDYAISAQAKIENTMDQDFKFVATFDLTNGPNPDDEAQRFSFVNEVLVSGIRENSIKYIAVKYFVGYPPTGLNFVSDFEWLPGKLKYKLDSKLDQSSANFKLTASTDPAGLYDIYLAAKVRDKGFKFEARREMVESHKSKFTNALEIFPEKLYQLNALVSHKFAWSDLDFSIQAELKTPSKPQHLRISTGIQNNDEKFLVEYFFEADTKVYIDFFTERIKGPKSKGNFKLLLTDYIESKGDFGFQDSVLKGSGYIVFINSRNKMVAEVDMIIKHLKYSGTIDLVWTSALDETKTIKIITDNDIESSVFDTKNIIIYEGQENKLNLNIKKAENGPKRTMDIALEIKLGDCDHLVTKYAHNLNSIPNNSDGEFMLDINHKGTSTANPTNILIKLLGKQVDFDQGKIDGHLTATYSTPQGKDVVVQIAHKKMPIDEKWIVNSMVDASGSMMQAPVNIKLETELARSLFADSVAWSRILPPSSYRIVASFGSDMNLEAYGKMTGNTYSGEINVKLPQDYKLSSFKWSTINLAQLNPGPDNQRQIKMSNLFKWNEKFFEIDNEFILMEEGGSIKFDWETDSFKKQSLYLISHWSLREEGMKDFDLSFKYDKEGKASDAFFKYSFNNVKGEGNLHFHGNCPANGIYDLKIASKRFHEGKGFHTEWVLVANNKTKKGLYKILRLQDHPYIEYYIEDENNAKSGFLIKADRKGIGEWTGNIHVEWAMEPLKKGFFYVNSEMKLISMDDFQVKIEANSNKYNLKEWLLEVYSIQSQQIIGPRNVAFRMKHDSQILLNGTASYDLNYIKDGIYKIEASGNAMIEGVLQPLSMKAMWKPTHPRIGFNGSLVQGENTITIESVFEDTDIYYVRKYCSPKLEKKCSEARIIWHSVESDPEYQEDKKLDVVLDLSSLNPSLDDFVLKANIKRNKNIVDHRLELKWLKDRTFTYKGFIHEDKAGLTIGLPKRIISGDVAFQLPHDVNQGRLFIEANLWLNKINEPEKKTYFLLTGELNRDKEVYALSSEVQLTHPSLQKSYGVKGKATVGKRWTEPKSDGHFEFNIFKNTDDTITLAWNMGNSDEKSSYSSRNNIVIRSKGLKMNMGYDRRVTMNKMSISWIDSLYYIDENGVKRETFITVDIKPRKFLLSFKLPDVQMYDVSFNLERKNRKVSLLGSYELAGTKYKEAIHIHPYQNVSYQFQFGKGKTLYVDFGFGIGQIAEFKASMNKNPIYEWQLGLYGEDFFRTKIIFNKDNFKQFWDTVGEEVTIIANSYDNEIKRAVDRDGKAFSQLVQRISQAVADPTPLLLSYQQDAQIILKEILEDEELKEALFPLRELLSSAVEQGVEIIEGIMKITKEMTNFGKQAADFVGTIISSMSVKIKETSKAASIAIGHATESILNAYLSFFDSLVQEINKYQKEINAVSETVFEFSKDLAVLTYNVASRFEDDIQDFIKLSMEEIKMTHLYKSLKDKMNELINYRVSEGFWPDTQEILRVMAESAPNPELRKLINTVIDFLDRFVKDEKLDFENSVKQIYRELLDSIKPTLDSIYDAFTFEETLFNNKFWIPMPWLTMWKTGSSSGGVKLSTIKWILSSDFPSIIDYSLHSWNSFCHVLPPYKARAYLFSNEMVTYDGREVSLQDGTYVLTQELENKFSVLAEVKNSVITSIQLTKGSDTVHFTQDGKVWMNGKELEHNIKSKDGKPGAHFTLAGGHLESEEISVKCQSDLKICRLILRGPAFAKVRGILGTYNYESFDEFTLPTGKLSTDENEFVNSWRLEGVSEVKNDHTHLPQQKCTQLFTSSNQLMLCYRLVDPKPFREMCDHAVGKAKTPETKKKALCQSVQHYTRACRANNLKISLPPPCDVCEVDGKEVTTDEFKFMQAPEKKADIVFMVELDSENTKIYESLLIPFTEQLKKELNTGGINDVEFGLVGFGSKDHSYINYFRRNGKLQFKDSIPNNLPWENPSSQRNKYQLEPNATIVDKIWHKIDKFLIADDETERGIVRSGIIKNYPWRAGSYRSVVTLVSSPCPLTEPVLSPLTRIKMAQRLLTMKSYGIVYNLITPVQEIMTTAINTKDILGFTKDELYLKNNIETGPAAKERRLAMSYLYDVCHLFPMETGGNVIVSDNLKSENGAAEGVAKLVAKSLLKQKIAYQCQCTINRGLHPIYECNVQS